MTVKNIKNKLGVVSPSHTSTNDKILVTDIDIIVEIHEKKPYYLLKYTPLGHKDYSIGYGSYDLENVVKWKEEWSIKVDKYLQKAITDVFKMEDPTISNKKINEIIEECKGLMNVSYFKYGPAKKNFGEGRVEAIGSIDNCIIKFRRTKNLEYLEDIINYALLRILYPLPGEFLVHTDSNESAGVDGTPVNEEADI